jgi:methylene-fatty-acyl-phospholipid synthase
VNWSLLAVAAVVLSLERICYVAIWRAPAAFQVWCAHPAVRWMGEPVRVLQWLFIAFKALQIAVFLVWCYVHGRGDVAPPALAGAAIATGVLLMVGGQVLNAMVFYRLGAVGVFYGNRLGHTIPWCRAFPFSRLNHPQYVGTVLSIWGLFLAMRFPQADWFVLPALETAYYLAGAHLEQ